MEHYICGIMNRISLYYVYIIGQILNSIFYLYTNYYLLQYSLWEGEIAAIALLNYVLGTKRLMVYCFAICYVKYNYNKI